MRTTKDTPFNVNQATAPPRSGILIAALALAGLSTSFLQAQEVISSDFTQDGGTFTVSPIGQLTISGSDNPQLTLTNGADSSGLQGLRVGTTDFETPSSGRLRIEAGSEMDSGGTSLIGTQANSSGTVTVTGTDSYWNSSSIRVGSSGNGILNIENGGYVLSGGDAIVGSGLSGEGTVTVSGSGSTWWNSTGLTIGQWGSGAMTISNGGHVRNNTGIIASNNDSSGNVTVTGEGSIWTNNNDLILGGWGTTSATTGEGTLTISDGGTVIVGGTTSIHGFSNPSAINLLAGGTLQTQSLLGSSRLNWAGGNLMFTGTSGAVSTIPEDGTLGGTGTYTSNITNFGTVSPGFSTGTLTIDADLDNQGSILFEIADLLDHDVLVVTGTAELDGILSLVLDGYSPEEGDSFALLDFGTLVDDGYSFDFSEAELSAGLSWDTGSFNDDGSISVIPEPAQSVLLLGALALGGIIIRRSLRA